MKRKFDNDNLVKMQKVPKEYWSRCLKSTIQSSIKYEEYLNQLSTLVGAPRNLDSSQGVRIKQRNYVNRPISPRHNNEKLKINKIEWNTEIVIIEEFNEKSTFDSFSDESIGEEEANYTLYSESNLDQISIVDSEQDQNKKQRRKEIFYESQKKMQLKAMKTFIRQKTLMQPSEKQVAELDSDNDEELFLDGDYILRSALLKDYDIQELSTKEMKHTLLNCWKIHIGQNENGYRISAIYQKPEIKEVSEEEVNTMVIQFLRDLRKAIQPKIIMDLLDDIQHQIEKVAPYGSMMRIMYKVDDEINKNRDVWMTPNREDTYWGMVRVSNFMKYFWDCTEQGKNAILIKNVFEVSGFGSEKWSAVTVNGNKKGVTDETPELWLHAAQALSEATGGNLSNIPTENYQFHLFWIPLKGAKQTKYNPTLMKDKQEDDVISISSLASLDEEKPIIWKSAMIMFFLWKRKLDRDQFGIEKVKRRSSMFSFKVSDKNHSRIRTKFLIQALHDLADHFGAHNEKIFMR